VKRREHGFFKTVTGIIKFEAPRFGKRHLIPEEINIYPILGLSPSGCPNDLGIKLFGGSNMPTREGNVKLSVHRMIE